MYVSVYRMKYCYGKSATHHRKMACIKWLPLNSSNRNNESLCFKMTDVDIACELESTVIVLPTTAIVPISTDVNIHSPPTSNSTYLIKSQPTNILNYSSGSAAWCLDIMVSATDHNAPSQYQTGKYITDKIVE